MCRESIIQVYPKVNYFYGIYNLKFKGIRLKQNCACFLNKNIVSLHIAYKLVAWSKDLNKDFKLVNCLFELVKLTKNTDLDKYKYSSCGIGLDLPSRFLWTNECEGKNVIIFGVEDSSPVHIYGRNRNILVLGEGPTQGVDNTT